MRCSKQAERECVSGDVSSEGKMERSGNEGTEVMACEANMVMEESRDVDCGGSVGGNGGMGGSGDMDREGSAGMGGHGSWRKCWNGREWGHGS
jgi:hypothetical protein